MIIKDGSFQFKNIYYKYKFIFDNNEEYHKCVKLIHKLYHNETEWRYDWDGCWMEDSPEWTGLYFNWDEADLLKLFALINL